MEEVEAREQCTFYPQIHRNSAEKENTKGMMNRRRSTEEFLRDQQLYEEQRRAKREMLKENLIKKE